jgi:lipoprotein-anchoring transpeptidase ErfK/SrfK
MKLLSLFFLITFSSLHAEEITIVKNSLRSSLPLGIAQEKGEIFPQILENKSNKPISIRISLSQQRLFVDVGDKCAIMSPISSGRRPGWTPVGFFKILEKDEVHRSNIYGNFVDRDNRVIRRGVDARLDSAPTGTHFKGASMLYFMKITEKGVGMHVGILPGYPASHGCIRLPLEMAKSIFKTVPLNTPVRVEE